MKKSEIRKIIREELLKEFDVPRPEDKDVSKENENFAVKVKPIFIKIIKDPIDLPFFLNTYNYWHQRKLVLERLILTKKDFQQRIKSIDKLISAYKKVQK